MVFTPDVPLPPGRTLEREIEARGLSKKEVASRLDISEKHLIDVISGKVGITPQLALKLEYVFGISAKTWLQMDTTYQATRARQAEAELLQEEKSLYKKFKSKNVTLLIKMGCIPNVSTMDEKIRELKSFMGVSTLKAVEKLYWNPKYYRKSSKFELNTYALALRLRVAEREAQKQTDAIREFQKGNVKKLTDELKPMMRRASVDVDKVKMLCNKYGIYFVFTPENFEQVPVKGVVWYHKNNPIIHLSNKGKYLDIFWFNLLHELGHIALHLGKKDMYLDAEDKSTDKEEKEADRFACDTILSENEYNKVLEKPDAVTIERIAKRNAIHYSLIFGRLAKDNIWSWKKAQMFRTKVLDD